MLSHTHPGGRSEKNKCCNSSATVGMSFQLICEQTKDDFNSPINHCCVLYSPHDKLTLHHKVLPVRHTPSPQQYTVRTRGQVRCTYVCTTTTTSNRVGCRSWSHWYGYGKTIFFPKFKYSHILTCSPIR